LLDYLTAKVDNPHQGESEWQRGWARCSSTYPALTITLREPRPFEGAERCGSATYPQP